MPSVSIVIPVFNKWDMTRDCLRSMAAHVAHGGLEVVVVDNASSDATPTECADLGASLFGGAFRYLRNEANLGFARACNMGAAAATGERVFFLNNDTLFTEDPLPALLDELARDDTGCCGPLLLYPDRTIQHMGIGFLHARKCIHIFRKYPANHRVTRRTAPVQAISAAAMLVDAALFDSLGRFFEGYVNGYEDLDLCARMGERGLRCAIRTDVSMVHLESQSVGRFDNESENFAVYDQRLGRDYETDLDRIARAHGMDLALNEWFEPYFVPGPALAASYAERLRSGGLQAIMDVLEEDPSWEDGYYTLIGALDANDLHREAFTLAVDLTEFCPSLRALDTALDLARKVTRKLSTSEDNARHIQARYIGALEIQYKAAAEQAAQPSLMDNARTMRAWARTHGRDHLFDVLTKWTTDHAA